MISLGASLRQMRLQSRPDPGDGLVAFEVGQQAGDAVVKVSRCVPPEGQLVVTAS